jgi:hypothetical protein
MISKFNLLQKDIIEDFEELNSLDLDLFISGFENSERVTTSYSLIRATQKVWVVFPQLGLKAEEFPSDRYFMSTILSEDEYFLEFFEQYKINGATKIGIDITGFIRPHLIYIVRYLAFKKVRNVYVIYTEPKQYKKGHETDFSGFVDDVRIVPACGSSDNNYRNDNDILILGVGYDDDLISKVAQNKRSCKTKYELFGFPSLQPDMYQESVLQATNVKETIGENIQTRFAPAYDPFITACVLKEIIDDNANATNIYLSPLSSKPQVLGFAYYYCIEGMTKPLSIIYPYSNRYPKSTSIGCGRTWMYKLEF